MTTVESENTAGGLGGGLPACSLDLTKRGDVALLRRAVRNRWPIPQHIKDALGRQFDAMLQAAEAEPNPARRAARIIRNVQLLMLMDAENLRDELRAAGVRLRQLKVLVPVQQKRYPRWQSRQRARFNASEIGSLIPKTGVIR